MGEIIDESVSYLFKTENTVAWNRWISSSSQASYQAIANND